MNKIDTDIKKQDQLLMEEVRKAILDSQMLEKKIEKSCDKLVRSSQTANSEATIASRFEDTIKEILKYFNESYEPVREESIVLNNNTDNSFLKSYQSAGRIDSRFGNVVTEYKVDITKNIEKNKLQLTEYIESLAKREEKSLDKFFGVLTDGQRILFMSYSSSIKNETLPQSISVKTFKELIKVYISLEKKELSEKGLIADFSLDSENKLTKNLAKKLYTKLSENPKMTFALEWENLFKLGGHNDNNMKSIKERRKVLSAIFDVSVDQIDETVALFSLQTSYVVIIKLIAYNVMAEIYFKNSEFSLNFSNLVSLESDGLRNGLINIDSGKVFQQVGFVNLIESDFFSWYLEAEMWDNEICDLIKEIIETLSEYDPGQRMFNRSNVHDFFKYLYQSIIPREVRHSLGEYYTPDWLVDHVIGEKIEAVRREPGWKSLDPCCGSGTFVMKLVEYVLKENRSESDDMLDEILNRVHGHDINPLAVLTCRINYFMVISRFLNSGDDRQIEIPISIGDSALVPNVTNVDGINIISYEMVLADSMICFQLPKEMLVHTEYYLTHKEFEKYLYSIDCDKGELNDLLTKLDKKSQFGPHIEKFVDQAMELKNQGWSQYWMSTVFSILGTVVKGKYDFIASNPPWIDWKSLPDGYREVLKKASIEQHVFSGDNFTGGINLNLCALIANITADTWLSKNGIMGLLMPKSIVFQQTYTGFRKLVQTHSDALYFSGFVDWSKAGKPFDPVSEKFLTYYFSKNNQINDGLTPVKVLTKKRGADIFDKKYKTFSDIEEKYISTNEVAYQISEINNNFTFTQSDNMKDISNVKKIVGESYYKGRVGLGLYPKEAMLFQEVKNDALVNKEEKVWFENYQNSKTERKVAQQKMLLETRFLHPVIEGPDISKFSVSPARYYAALPYTAENTKKPIVKAELKAKSPGLLSYYESVKNDMKKTDYNKKVQGGKGEFYSITRVGTYTFSPYKVLFRNNTKWNASVISKVETFWEELKEPLLLDHACSISQNNNGEDISLEEAHYICAILNSEIVTNYILDSSDARSFKTNIPINVIKYDDSSRVHKQLSELSQKAHEGNIPMDEIDVELELLIERYIDDL